MSFYTSLCYYRPGNAPVVTGGALAGFIQSLADTQLVQSSPFRSLKVKFGSAIDHDAQEVFWVEPINSVVGEYREIDWDLDIFDTEDLETILSPLVNENRHIYRASANLGFLKDTITTAISREPSEENQIGFFPDSFSVSIGPVKLSILGTESAWHAGWIDVSIHGGGYLYPMTFDELVAKASASKEILQLCEICRRFWPVPSRQPEAHEVSLRRQNSDLWPYEDLSKALDWYWGLVESG